METAITDYSWNYKANPDNTPWVPGYRFFVMQSSLKSRGWKHSGFRRYRVHFEIGPDASLRWTGGVKARPDTLERVQSLYAAKRPGSNYGP